MISFEDSEIWAVRVDGQQGVQGVGPSVLHLSRYTQRVRYPGDPIRQLLAHFTC